MLKDADQKLNKILSNMENEIDEIDHDTSDQPGFSYFVNFKLLPTYLYGKGLAQIYHQDNLTLFHDG